MLKLTDLRKTTRRSNSGSWRTLHPHFSRDRSLAPRIELAVRYFESMLGQPRNELDPEVVIQLFGDHKLARCIVAYLAASYHHHSHTFAEVLPASQIAALRARGLRIRASFGSGCSAGRTSNCPVLWAAQSGPHSCARRDRYLDS